MKLRLYDNTRLSAFKRCPRYYMFRHVLHWAPTGKSVPLIFGGAWHAAMEVVWHGIRTEDRVKLAKAAFGAFLQHWTAEGMPSVGEMDYEQEKELSPRTPSQAFEMIVGYIDFRKPQADDFELISIEQPFAVPLDPQDDTLFYVGKVDKIVRRRSKILGVEHKTTTAYKKNGPFRSTFTDSFSPNAQVDGYLYALHLMYPGEVGGVWVDAALVHKSEEGFLFIPVERQLPQLDSWLYDTHHWIAQVEAETRKLEGAADQPYLQAFPKNTNSCFDFNMACPYIGPCKVWANPLGYQVPPGFEIEKWDPLKHIKGLEELTDAEAA